MGYCLYVSNGEAGGGRQDFLDGASESAYIPI